MTGKYNSKFIWMQVNESKDSTFGEEEQTWVDGPELWGEVVPLSGAEIVRYGILKSEVKAKINIHNMPPIDFKDKLRDKADGTIWTIDGILAWDNQLEIAVH